MLRISSRITISMLNRPIPSRSYATPTFPIISPLPSYDPVEDPQLAGLDYPKLPTTSRQARNPLGWWDTQERINFDEPLPENDDLQSMWAPDIHSIAPLSAFTQLMAAFAGLGLFSGFVYLIQASPPGLPRAYPFDGLVREMSGTDDTSYAARPSSANEIEE